MHRKKLKISRDLFQPDSILSSIIYWANCHFPLVCVLNSNTESYTKNHKKSFDTIIAAGSENELLSGPSGSFDRLKFFLKKQHSASLEKPLFGFFSYDLKNELENLSSSGADGIEMPLMHFFAPEHIFTIKGNELTAETTDAGLNLEKIISDSPPSSLITDAVNLTPRISRRNYIDTVNRIREHIFRGDVYELNYCQEFYAENAEINPTEVYLKLNELSPMPFSCYYKFRDKYLLCSSPERYLKKNGNKIISQPIKGTIRRGENENEDLLMVKKLLDDKKELSENVMIVDLVRNDLSHIAKAGTVKVEELFGVYSFRHLHQMISTISCELDEKHHFIDAIKNTFPMGSMTGAPKVKAMELIEKFEATKRGLFSGAVGYITPGGNFDFNVVIRSILYNKKNSYVSAMAGSAITAECSPEKEYEECLLKAAPMFRALGTPEFALSCGLQP